MTNSPNTATSHIDERFGTLVLVPAMNSYAGTASWQDTVIDLHCSLDDTESLQQVLPVAHALWQDQSAWQDKLHTGAIARLLELKNSTWLEEDEQPLSAADFAARITLLSVTVYAGGGFEFLYHDGDLFWGHVIEVSGSLENGVMHADILG
jgi:hypothetical protein